MVSFTWNCNTKHSPQPHTDGKFQIHNRTISNNGFYFPLISHQWILDDCKIYDRKYMFGSNVNRIRIRFLFVFCCCRCIIPSSWNNSNKTLMMRWKVYIWNEDNSYASRIYGFCIRRNDAVISRTSLLFSFQFYVIHHFLSQFYFLKIPLVYSPVRSLYA